MSLMEKAKEMVGGVMNGVKGAGESVMGGADQLVRKIVEGYGELVAKYDTDKKTGCALGGYSRGRGIYIQWQDGPRGQGEDRVKATGASVEDVLRACQHRLKFFQTAGDGRMKCEENAVALACLGNAIKAMEARSHNRKTREVEGTFEP